SGFSPGVPIDSRLSRCPLWGGGEEVTHPTPPVNTFRKVFSEILRNHPPHITTNHSPTTIYPNKQPAKIFPGTTPIPPKPMPWEAAGAPSRWYACPPHRLLSPNSSTTPASTW